MGVGVEGELAAGHVGEGEVARLGVPLEGLAEALQVRVLQGGGEGFMEQSISYCYNGTFVEDRRSCKAQKGELFAQNFKGSFSSNDCTTDLMKRNRSSSEMCPQ